MIKKLLAVVAKKLFPYWCPYCPMRYRTEEKFHSHFRVCKYRKAAVAEAERKENEALRIIAPVNRDQRRRMAKKAGQIKDWKSLNAD